MRGSTGRAWSLLLAVLAVLVHVAYAHTIDLDAGAKECFFEDLHTEDKVRLVVSSSRVAPSAGRRRAPPDPAPLTLPSPLLARAQMTVTYQVAGGGHLDIDFKLTGPGNRVMNEQRKRDTGTYSFTAENDGRFTYCFSNEMSTVSGKTVRWAFEDTCLCCPGADTWSPPAALTSTESCTSRTTVSAPAPHCPADLPPDPRNPVQATRPRLSARSDNSRPPSRRSRTSKSTSSSASGYTATVSRPHTARLTRTLTPLPPLAAAESTNDRVKFWSILQTVMLIAVCGWQIFYLKRFFEVKRVV